MLFSVLRAHLQGAEVSRVHDDASAYWEERRLRLRRLLEGGRWSIHDVVNSPRVRHAVSEQWRLGCVLEQDQAVDDYIAYLELIDAFAAGVVPRPHRTRPSLFSL